MKPQSAAPGSAPVGTGAGTGGLVAGVAEHPASKPPGSDAAESAVNNGREDLTAFFTIGVVVDVLLVAAFLVWAVRQWRRKK